MLIHASGEGISFFDDYHVSQNFLNEWCDFLEIDEFNCPENAPLYVKNAYRMLDEMQAFYGIAKDDPRPMAEWIKQSVKEHGYFCCAKAIIGEVELVDVVAQKPDNDWAEDGWKYYWILENPKIYKKPIKNVLGKVRLWDFDLDLSLIEPD